MTTAETPERTVTAWSSVSRVVRRGVDIVRSSATRAPVSIGALVLLWVLAVVTGSVMRPSAHVLHHYAVGIVPLEHWRLWTPFTSGLFAPGLIWYLFATVLILIVAAPIEKRMGSVKFAIAAVVTQVLGALLGLAVAVVAKLLDESWGLHLHDGTSVGPTTWIVGVAMVASSNMQTLWRRRIRVGLLALLITLVLFSGHLHDTVRLGAALAGLVVGRWIVGKSARGARLAGTRREGRVLVAIIVAATALGPAFAALTPDAVGPFAVLRELFRGTAYDSDEVAQVCAQFPKGDECRQGELSLRLAGVGPTILSLMPSLFLLVLADGLRRGRKFAWTAAVVAQVILLGLALLNYLVRFVDPLDTETIFYGLDSSTAYRTIAPFIPPLIVLAVLIWTRAYFDVRAPAGTYRKLLIAMIGLTVGLGVVYFLGGLAVRGQFDPGASAGGLVKAFPERLVPPVYLQWLDPAFLPDQFVATFLYEWTGVVFWLAACVLVGRTFLAPAYGTETDATEKARDLLRASGGTALSWMTTWRGNKYWFNPSGTGYVAYRVVGGVALTTGDPVGPREQLRDNVIGFAEFASSNGWTPCYYSVGVDVKRIADDLGWGGIQVAEETVLELSELAFTGKKFQDVRTALNRAKKSGITAEWISFPTAPLALTDQITVISEEWVADKGMPEMGFTLGGLEEIDDPEVRCLVALDADRTVEGVTSWLPVYENGTIVGWTLDFMRRRSDGAFRPAMEFLIASAALTLKDEGATFVSLSGAPLAKVETGEPDSDETAASATLDKLLDVLGKALEPVDGFRSLLAFKSKFQPTYVPMYMVFADPAALPSIGNAIGRAYLPEVTFGQTVNLMRTIIKR